jgi:hypothetical protein
MSTDTELAGIRQTLEVHERWLGAMATGQHTLAQQIGEIAISIRDIERNFPDMMAKSLRQMITDPTVWVEVRHAMTAKAAFTVFGGLASSIRWLGKVMVFIAVVYAIGGAPAALVYLRHQLGAL